MAGGILLLLDGIAMVRGGFQPPAPATHHGDQAVSIGIAPLAIPLLAGPGTISTIVIYTNLQNGDGHLLLVAAAVVTAALGIYTDLRLAVSFGNPLGATARLVWERIMGLIVLSIGVEFIVDGITTHVSYLRGLGH